MNQFPLESHYHLHLLVQHILLLSKIVVILWIIISLSKKFYKHYIIYILVKGKYRLYNVDKEISNNFKLDRVNVIKLNNLDIESIIEYEDNRYVNLYAKTKIIKIINRYRL